jgi:hypothetical protein
MSRIAALLVVACTLSLAGPAHALPPWMQPGKAGRFMFNLKLGPAFDVKDTVLQGAIVPEMGIAVDRDFNAYIILPLPNFQASADQSIVMVPVGFQYDIAIKPVPGLYITPAATTGYAAFIYNYNCNNCSQTFSAGFFQPEVGAKLIFNRRFNVGFIPFSLPIFFGSATRTIVTNNGTIITSNGTFTVVSYRILFYGGINF